VSKPSVPAPACALDVAIFGAGVAGLASAVALHAIGHRCHVYEQRVSNLEAGMAFILMPDALARLDALGVAAAGHPIRRYAHRDQSGAVAFESLMPAGVRCVRRAQLLQALRARLPAQALLARQGGLSHFEFDDDGRVRRAWVTVPPDAEPGLLRPVTADLFIAADGTRSTSRQALFPGLHAAPARVFEVVGLLEDAESARWAGEDFNKFHALSGGTAFGLLPTGGDTLVWYLQFDAESLPPRGLRSAQDLVGFAHGRLEGWAAPVSRALARADFSKAHLWQPLDADPPASFHRANLVLTGDAAHPLLPFSSQGVSAAVLDAVTLADALRGDAPVATALERYSLERRGARLPYVTQGRALTQRFFEPVCGGMLPMALTQSFGVD
jgi:2-polyprenyl-6-methoxyphenol hydroxylase-like FAD-dependent oxidoreductase